MKIVEIFRNKNLFNVDCNETAKIFQIFAILGAELWIRIQIQIGSRFNWVCGSGSGFGIQIRIQEDKIDQQNKEKVKKLHVLKRWMFFLEG